MSNDPKKDEQDRKAKEQQRPNPEVKGSPETKQNKDEQKPTTTIPKKM